MVHIVILINDIEGAKLSNANYAVQEIASRKSDKK